jgi:Regulator of ribonuclease activity B
LIATALNALGDDANGISESDPVMLGALIENGSDLSERRHIVHYPYCSSAHSAWALREEASANGFTVRVAEPQMTGEPTEPESRAFRKEIAATGLVEVIPTPVGPERPTSGHSGWTDWHVCCDKYEVLSPSSIRSNTVFFSALAGRHGAVYDRWEAALQ